MKEFHRILLWLLGVLGASAALRAQSLVVGVRADYTGGGSNARLSLGDPVNLMLSGSGDRADSKDIEMLMDDPVMLSVVAQDVGSFQVVFTPPAGYWMLINGIRQTALTGTGGSHRVTLVRRESALAGESPLGEPSSIQWVPPTSATPPRWPYLAFNLGAGRNGESLPPLRIPLARRTTLTNDLVLPDTPELTNPTMANGGFQFSVPQADVKLEVHADNSGDFDLTFMSPGTITPFVIYHFQKVTWNGDASSQLKKIRVEKEVPGGLRYETTIEGYYSEAGILATNGTWTIGDWHTTTSAAGRIISGTRSWSNQDETVPTEFRVAVVFTDSVEVRPASGSPTIVSKTTSQYNNWRIGEADDYFDIVIPKQTTDGVGDGDYVTQVLTNPNFENVQGTQAPDGSVRIDVAGAVFNPTQPLQLLRTTYETWLDSSPSIASPDGFFTINPNGGIHAMVLREMDPRWVAFDWPKSIERTVGGTLLSRTAVTYDESTPPGLNHAVITATRRDYSSAAGYVETVTKRFRPDLADAALRDRVYSVQLPAGAKQSFAYATGTWSGTSWSADFRITMLAGATTGGTAVNGVDGSTVDSLQMLPNKSTKMVEYLQRGRLVRREVWVYLSGGGTSPGFNPGDPVAWETIGYTADGRLSFRTTSTGSSYSASWSGTRKTSQSDETGLTTTFIYDDFDRVKSMTQTSASGVAAQSVSFDYDAAHRIRFRRVGAVDGSGNPTGEQRVTETEYDRAGRVKRVKTPGQGTTTVAGMIITDFAYANGGRDVQTNYSVGTAQAASKSVVRWVDGRVKSVTGSAVVEERTTYDFDSSSRPRVTRTFGPLQRRAATTVFDLLGRPVEERMNGFGLNGTQKPLVTYREYDPSTGLLKKSFTIEQGTGIHISGDQLMTYDAFGHLMAAGIDVNANGTLDAASTDRFEEFDTSFVNDSGAWWRRLTGTRYHTNGSPAAHVSKSDTRLTGLTGMIAQSIAYDYHNNPTTRTVLADTIGKTHRLRTRFADGTTSERTTVGGLVISDRSFADTDPNLTGSPVLATTYTYDALGRITYATDARTGSAEMNYWFGTALPREQRDARTVLVTSHTYDGAGRLASTTNPAGTVNYVYTSRNELYEASGAGTHPSRRVYSDYGELKELKTYRNGLAGTADITSWTYDDNTGWLVAKTDAATQIVSYDYSFVQGFREVIRHSARSPSTPTTARYSLSTGDLVKIDYTDGTPDVDFLEYDREGNLKQVQDAIGLRTLSYHHGQLVTESLPTWFNSLVLTTDYHTATSTSANAVAGRYYRWKLGVASDLDREMSVTYGYDDFGRINGVTADYRAQGSRPALTVPATYQYKASSALWETLSQGSFGVTRAFENNRDVLTSITSTHSTAGTVTFFGYGTDDAGRREWATQSGMAFQDFVDTSSDATYYRYGYNATSELETAIGYRGINPAATTSPLPGRGFGFTYCA